MITVDDAIARARTLMIAAAEHHVCLAFDAMYAQGLTDDAIIAGLSSMREEGAVAIEEALTDMRQRLESWLMEDPRTAEAITAAATEEPEMDWSAAALALDAAIKQEIANAVAPLEARVATLEARSKEPSA